MKNSLARFRLNRELARWEALGETPRLWWRDDDAGDAGAALERLLRAAAGLPLSLAVVPHGATAALARRLTGEARITVSQHGVDHRNHREPGSPAGEYPPGLAITRMAEHIRQGEQYLRRCGIFPRFYTPAWNRIDGMLAEALPLAGFHDLSGWNEEESNCCAGLNRLDVHIGLLRWRGGARFRGERRILDDLRRQLELRRTEREFERPIGLLTHHLDHDEAAWNFLDWFLYFARSHFEIGGYYDFLEA